MRRTRRWRCSSGSIACATVTRKKPDVVHHALVRIEETEIPLGSGTGLEILVEESKDEDVDGSTGTKRSTRVGGDVLDEITIVLLRIRDAATDLGGISSRRPSSFGDDDRDIRVSETLHSREHGIQLRVEDVGVVQTCVEIRDTGIGLEEGVSERDVLGIAAVRKVRISIDHEEGRSRVQEVEQSFDGSCKSGIEGASRRREGFGKHGERMRCGD